MEKIKAMLPTIRIIKNNIDENRMNVFIRGCLLLAM